MRGGRLAWATLCAGLLLGDVPLAARGTGVDEICVWQSLSGASFNLQGLTVTDPRQDSYEIHDGDIPCTPETEPTYSFMWNLCEKVTNASVPQNICHGKRGAAMQYLNRTDGWTECHVIGKYDATQDDSHYTLLDSDDPSKGVSIKYAAGEKCPSGVLRTATIDLQCADTRAEVVSALEPQVCQYHMVMRSYYGFPVQCPITSNGLCNSHGHCHYDGKLKQPYCYCNWGYSGNDCSTYVATALAGSAGASAMYSVQVGLLVILLLIAMGLIGVVGFMVLKITKYRKEQADSYSLLASQSEHGIMGGDRIVEMQSF